MAYLFYTQNNRSLPNTETLLISPFKEIWERDKSADKAQAIKEFSFMELMCSKKKTNPFSGYSYEERKDKVAIMLGLVEGDQWDTYNPDELIVTGMNWIEDFQTKASPTYSYYLDCVVTAENTRKFLKNIDLNEKNDRTGNYLNKPKDVTSALVDTEKILQGLYNMKERVEQELFDVTKTRSNREINHYEM